MSPLVPAVLFTSEEGTNPDVVTVTPESFTITVPEDAAIAPGGTLQLIPAIINDISSPGPLDGEFVQLLESKPESFTWIVRGIVSDGMTRTVEFNTRTYIDKHAVLHLQKTEPREFVSEIDVPVSTRVVGWGDIAAIAIACVPTGTDELPTAIVNVPVAHD